MECLGICPFLTVPSVRFLPLAPSTNIKTLSDEIKFDKEKIKNAIIKFYNNNRIFKLAKPDFEGYLHYVTKIVSVTKINILRISSNLLSVRLDYRWRIPDFNFQRNGRGLAMIEITGKAYRVIEFETDGTSYLPNGADADDVKPTKDAEPIPYSLKFRSDS